MSCRWKESRFSRSVCKSPPSADLFPSDMFPAFASLVKQRIHVEAEPVVRVTVHRLLSDPLSPEYRSVEFLVREGHVAALYHSRDSHQSGENCDKYFVPMKWICDRHICCLSTF